MEKNLQNGNKELLKNGEVIKGEILFNGKVDKKAIKVDKVKNNNLEIENDKKNIKIENKEGKMQEIDDEDKKTLKEKKKTKRQFRLKILKRLFHEMIPYKWQYVVMFLFYIINVVCNVIGTLLMAKIIDDCILPLATHTAGVGYKDFIIMICVLAGVYGLGGIATYVANLLSVYTSTKILNNIRIRMFSHVQKLSIKFFDTHTHGDIMSCYTNDVDTLREFFTNGLPTLFSSSLTILTIFIVMLIMSPLLTLMIVIMVILMMAIVAKIGGKSGKFFVKQQMAIGKVNGFIEEHVEGQKVVKVFNHEKNEKKDFDKANEALFKASATANGYANIVMPILINLTYINFALTSVFGGIFAVFGFGGMTFGKLTSFLLFSRQFGGPISQMAEQINIILMALAGANRVYTLLDEKPEEDNGYVTLVNAKENEKGELVECEERTGVWAWKHFHKATGKTTLAKLNGEVQFDDVTFGYNPDKIVLKDIDLFAHDGQKIALVGSTGAGKTTITNLINRFYEVPDGKIRYDGINVTKIKKDDLRRSMSMVLQDTHLFTGTVSDNIRYGKLDATDEEVKNAAVMANADYFISLLPKGYDTILTADGGNLSQGQRQLLSIARALIADPPVLILDEATSSIDMRTEKLIEQGLNNLMKGRTVFVIAHRLSTVRNADKILVLEHGEIIEQGNHDELIKQKGKYYQLYTGAFELD